MARNSKNPSGTSTLLPRAKINSSFSLLLALLTAIPTGLPVLSPMPPHNLSDHAPALIRLTGLTVGKLDPRSSTDWSQWYSVSDDAEEADGRDDFHFVTFCQWLPLLDIPSLIPTSIEPALPDHANPFLATTRSPQLRC